MSSTTTPTGAAIEASSLLDGVRTLFFILFCAYLWDVLRGNE